jgi:hypothetical protein
MNFVEKNVGTPAIQGVLPRIAGCKVGQGHKTLVDLISMTIWPRTFIFGL